MSENINTKNNTAESFKVAAAHAGLVLMAVAATLGVVEGTDQFEKRALVAQPSYAQTEYKFENNNQRRERDEVGPHYLGYSTSQRTPSRSGKL